MCRGRAATIDASGRRRPGQRGRRLSRRPVLDISADDWQFVFQVNVLGTYFMMIEAMRRCGPGAVVGS